MPHSPYRIAVILEGRVQYERNVLRGIRDFAAETGDWFIRFEFPGSATAAFIRQWRPDGILFQSAGIERELIDLFFRSATTIHLSESPEGTAWPGCGLDNARIGRCAADHLVERGFGHFAFVGFSGSGFSRSRGRSFARRIEEGGREPVRILTLDGSEPEDAIQRWLSELPRPCGLFATHDECSLFLTAMCRSAGVRVPEDIAILGVDDDTLICELAWPQLSSIAVPSRRVGWEAANRLNRQLRGAGRPGEKQLLLPPTGVVTRHSTDVHQTEDESVNRALRVMSSRLASRLNIDEVLRETGVSRRLLERKFRRHVGRSPLQELQRLRMAEAKRLLLETRFPLHQVAARCGCRDANHLIALFKKALGMTPGQFRESNRGGIG